MWLIWNIQFKILEQVSILCNADAKCQPNFTNWVNISEHNRVKARENTIFSFLHLRISQLNMIGCDYKDFTCVVALVQITLWAFSGWWFVRLFLPANRDIWIFIGFRKSTGARKSLIERSVQCVDYIGVGYSADF